MMDAPPQDPDLSAPAPSENGSPEAEAPHVCVLLGASNLARGYSALSHYLTRNLAPQPVRILAAMGPGRGYGCRGGMLNISYPPIVDSPLFQRARKQAESGSRVVALVTDIGNDLLYGMDPDHLVATLEEVFQRLFDLNARIFVTSLPVFFEQEVSPMVYHSIRALLYPKSSVSQEHAVNGVRRMNSYLKESKDPRVRVVPPLDEYLGWDHVHYSLLRSTEVWNRVGGTLLSGWDRQPRHPLRFPRMLLSYRDNLHRLLMMESLKCIPRSANLF
ncbi:hypothetical protein [Nitrospina watsonii]|uniref:SGNH hydrolase-type esterase domain-containing protein n=1 Tax=Nitrospina watsonii TaxID=1323948 RepID=A0ABN8W0J7_9BACT|nr:hypothetical protein [Nitrospina watsonii]CAI2719525.1 conserved protein of unknown function [Nitrospina watsonii]